MNRDTVTIPAEEVFQEWRDENVIDVNSLSPKVKSAIKDLLDDIVGSNPIAWRARRQVFDMVVSRYS